MFESSLVQGRNIDQFDRTLHLQEKSRTVVRFRVNEESHQGGVVVVMNETDFQ